MKTNFKFFFLLLVNTAFLSALVYGVAQSLVEQYKTVLSLGLLSVTVIGIAGMMRSIEPSSLAEAKVEKRNR